MLSQLTKGGKFKKVNLTGVGMESVVTNSCYLADVLEKANCASKEKVERILEAEVKGANWEHDIKRIRAAYAGRRRSKVELERREVRERQFEMHHLWLQECMEPSPCVLPR